MKQPKEPNMATNLTKTRLAKTTKEAKLGDLPATEKVDVFAKMALWSSANAAAVMAEYSKPFGDQDISVLVTSLSDTMDDMWAGDLSRAEAMLYAQAHALQSIFMNLARRAAKQEYLKQWEAYLRMALKAQSQCRTTLEALSEIKNPRTATFIKQQNVAGQQQVNNGQGAAHEKNITPTNELIGDANGEQLDTRTAGTPSSVNPKLAAVAAIDRAKVGAGKTDRLQKFV